MEWLTDIIVGIMSLVSAALMIFILIKILTWVVKYIPIGFLFMIIVCTILKSRK